MLALILAGGEGSRLRLGEKGLVPVCGKIMIERVIESFIDADCEPIVVTSHKTPYTKNWCRINNIEYIDTSGAGYIEDLHEAIEMSGAEGPVFTSATDIPCLRPEIITHVRDLYEASDKPAASAWTPLKYCKKYGITPRYVEEINGIPATPCAFNIFMSDMIDEEQDELKIVLDIPGLAFNINTRKELEVLESELRKIHAKNKLV